MDEAGRGALAGPLVAAAVILPEDFDLDGIRDSKQRTPNQRREAFERIVSGAEYSVCWADPPEVDLQGVHGCNLELLRRAAHELDQKADFVLVDGVVSPPDMELPFRMIRDGDDRSASIAAASIVAKVTQERMMDRLHEEHPGYGFDHNRGYGPAQWEPIKRLGPIPGVHRFSIKGIGSGSLESP